MNRGTLSPRDPSLDEINQEDSSDADGVKGRRREDSGTLLQGLLPPHAANKESATTFVVSENYFSVLGVAPVRGRAFHDMSSADLTASPAVLVSQNFWQTRFAGDPDIVGKTVRLNGAAF